MINLPSGIMFPSPVFVIKISVDGESFRGALMSDDGNCLDFFIITLSRYQAETAEEYYECATIQEVWDKMRETYEKNEFTRHSWDLFLKEFV